MESQTDSVEGKIQLILQEVAQCAGRNTAGHH